MIVNNGMKGALIRNAGLPSQYLEDLPPDDGSQRLYNLRDYSARFGGTTNLTESSILLADGRMLSMFELLKDNMKKFGIYTSGLNNTPRLEEQSDDYTYLEKEVDLEKEVIKLSTHTGAYTTNFNFQTKLPDGYQSLSLALEFSKVSSVNDGRCHLGLFSFDGFVPTCDYNRYFAPGVEGYRLFSSPTVNGIYLGEPGVEPSSSSTKLAGGGWINETWRVLVKYSSHNNLLRVIYGTEIHDVVMGTKPNTLFFGMSAYGAQEIITRILPSMSAV